MAAAVALLSLAACSSDDPDEGGAEVPRTTTTTSSTTSTTTAEQTYAVPETIDAAYVNRVMEALNKVYGDVVRKKVSSGEFREEDLIPIRAIYNDPEFEQAAFALGRSPIGDLAQYRDPLGDRKITVLKLMTAKPDCISFEAAYDFAAVVKESEPGHGWITLRPSQQDSDPANLNPTPWSVALEELKTETDGCSTA